MGLRPGQAKGPYVGLSGGGGTPANPTAIATWFEGIDIDYTDLNGTAGLTLDIELYNMPARCIVEGVAIKTAQEFAGPAIQTLNFSVGVVGNQAKHLSPYDVMAISSNVNFGHALQLQMENYGATTSVRVYIVATGANLTALTQGNACIWLKIARIDDCGTPAPAFNPVTCPIGSSYLYDDTTNRAALAVNFTLSSANLDIVDTNWVGIVAGLDFTATATSINAAITGAGEFTLIGKVNYRADVNAGLFSGVINWGLGAFVIDVEKTNLAMIEITYGTGPSEFLPYVAGTTREFIFKIQRVAGTVYVYRDGVFKYSFVSAVAFGLFFRATQDMTGADYLVRGRFSDIYLYRASAGLPTGVCTGP